MLLLTISALSSTPRLRFSINSNLNIPLRIQLILLTELRTSIPHPILFRYTDVPLSASFDFINDILSAVSLPDQFIQGFLTHVSDDYSLCEDNHFYKFADGLSWAQFSFRLCVICLWMSLKNSVQLEPPPLKLRPILVWIRWRYSLFVEWQCRIV